MDGHLPAAPWSQSGAAVLLYLCGWLGLFGDGFPQGEPSLYWRLVLATAIPALVHASLLIGFSAWSKSPRMAAASYAGFCLLSSIISGIIGGVEVRSHHVTNRLIQHLSVTGVIRGLAQSIFHVTLGEVWPTHHPPGFSQQALAAPPFWAMLFLAIGLIGLGFSRRE